MVFEAFNPKDIFQEMQQVALTSRINNYEYEYMYDHVSIVKINHS